MSLPTYGSGDPKIANEEEFLLNANLGTIRPQHFQRKVAVLLVALCVMVGGSVVALNRRDKVVRDLHETRVIHSEKVTLNGDTNVTSEVIPDGCEASVLILRHCEKAVDPKDDNGNDHCSYIGYQRAQYIATLFGDNTQARWPNPSYLYAMSMSRPNKATVNFREIETVQPLSDQLDGMEINAKYGVGESEELANDIFLKLLAGDLCGKLVVVSWKHKEIGDLAQELGCGEDQGCPKKYHGGTFDDVWEIKYVHKPPKPPVEVEEIFNVDLVTREKLSVPLEASNKKEKKKKEAAQQDAADAEALDWNVFGFVTSQNFDPLHFAKTNGVYGD